MRVKANRWWQTTHGMSDSPEYKVWNNMMSRCNNPNHPRYKDWGGRGIRVCDKWRTFSGFYEDMGKRPTDKHTIERRDNDKGYSKDNCYWATTKEQSANRRSNNIVYYEESGFISRDWAKKLGISTRTFYSRLQRGWDFVEIVEGKRTKTPRLLMAIARHKEGKHTRKCEQYIKRNTYRCKFTEEVFKKGVAYAKPYK